jgi:hypothetical protein
MTNSVTEIPHRSDPRRTITSTAAGLEMWADMQRKRAPELEWERFDTLIEELKAAVPGTGPVKDEGRYVRGRGLVQLVLEKFREGDHCHMEADALQLALEELDAGIDF